MINKKETKKFVDRFEVEYRISATSTKTAYFDSARARESFCYYITKIKGNEIISKKSL